MKPALQNAVHRQKTIEQTSRSLTNENGNSKARTSSRRSESRRMFCSSPMLRRKTCRICSAQRLSGRRWFSPCAAPVCLQGLRSYLSETCSNAEIVPLRQVTIFYKNRVPECKSPLPDAEVTPEPDFCSKAVALSLPAARQRSTQRRILMYLMLRVAARDDDR